MKRIAALLLAMVCLLSLPAMAEEIPIFDSLLDARDYLNEQVLTCPEEISFRLSDPDEYDGADFLARARSIGGQFRVNGWMDGDVVTLSYTYYPGMRIYHAVDVGDAADLTDDELAAAQIACDVAAEALEQSEDTFNLMLYLHNWLCENVTYEAMPEDYDEMPRVCGAVGALVDGRANCQGYADAFRLLGLLCGLEVRKQEGFDSDGGGHDWNVVCIEGDWFIVDVTWDDVDDSDTWNYAYLNAGTDVNNYTWNAGAAAADVCSITYPRMWFYTRTGREYSDVADMARAAYFARRDDGVEVFRGVVYQQGLDWEDLSQAILALAQERGKKCSWHIACSNRGPYSYYSVCWTQW